MSIALLIGTVAASSSAAAQEHASRARRPASAGSAAASDLRPRRSGAWPRTFYSLYSFVFSFICFFFY